MITFQEYCQNRQDEGLGSFIRGVVSPQYAALPQNLKDIYDSLNSSQMRSLRQLMSSPIEGGHDMPLAQAIESIPNLDNLQLSKLYKKRVNPVNRPDTIAGWKSWGH